MRSGLIAVLLVALVAPAGAAAATTWKLVDATCSSSQTKVGRGCWDQSNSKEWTASDGSATQTDPFHTPPTYTADYSWSVPDQVAGEGAPASVSTTAHDTTNGGGASSQICLSSSFTIKGGVQSCARASAPGPGRSDGPHETAVTLLPNDGRPGATATVQIGFGAGFVTYTYEAGGAAAIPPPVVAPTPTAFDQKVSVPAPAPGGVALGKSPPLGNAKSVTATTGGLTVEDVQVIAGLRHACYADFITGLSLTRKFQPTLKIVNGRIEHELFTDIEANVPQLLSNLAFCLAFVDAFETAARASARSAVAVDAAACHGFGATVTKVGHRAKNRLIRTGALRVRCKRVAGGLAVTYSTRSHQPLRRIVGSRLRVGVFRGAKDPAGGQLTFSYHKG